MSVPNDPVGGQRLELAVSVEVDGQPVPSETLFGHLGAYLVAISTTLAERQLPVTLTSSCLGGPSGQTAVSHLLLAPGQAPLIEQRTADAEELPVWHAGRRRLLLDHAARWQAAISTLGHDCRVQVSDHALELADHC